MCAAIASGVTGQTVTATRRKWFRGLMTTSTRLCTRQWQRFRLLVQTIGVESGAKANDRLKADARRVS